MSILNAAINPRAGMLTCSFTGRTVVSGIKVVIVNREMLGGDGRIGATGEACIEWQLRLC